MKRLEYRDQLLIRLAIESGLRISDLLKLKVGDVKAKMTIFETKSKRERTFKLSKQLYDDLRAWTRYRRRGLLLFAGNRGNEKAVHRSTVHRRIKKALQGLGFDMSAHSTRKLYAHNVFSETHDLQKVQNALNHKNLETTLAYLNIDTEFFAKFIVLQKESATNE